MSLNGSGDRRGRLNKGNSSCLLENSDEDGIPLDQGVEIMGVAPIAGGILQIYLVLDRERDTMERA